MRFLVIAFVTGCCASPYEYVPVVVAVAHPSTLSVADSVGDDEAAIVSRDPCDMREPNIATCSPVATVRAGEILGDARCFYDTRVQEDDVGRVLKCGASRAMIVFEHARFTGTFAKGALNVCATTTYDFASGDRCTWRSEQRIHGSLACGLGYSYSESPVAGESCTLACQARGVLTAIDR